jgi:DNA-binding MarR family transcriptional regulator
MIDDMSRDASAAGADFGFLLASAYVAYVRHLHARLVEQGFPRPRPAYGPVLRALQREPATASALAARIGVTKQALGRVVDEMRDADLVTAGSDPADGRARPLALTARGEAMVGAATAIGEEVLASLARSLGVDAAHDLRAGLERIVAEAGAADDLAARRLRAPV